MDTKLTLKLEQSIIEKAKVFAKNNNTSLSRLIENYLKNILDSREEDLEISPLVKSLSGIVDLPEDDEQGYSDYLSEKYK